MATIHLLQRVADLSHGGPGPSRVYRESQQVGVFGTDGPVGACGQRFQCTPAGLVVPVGPQPFQPGDLGGPHFGVVHLQHLDALLTVHLVAVHPHHGLGAGVDAGLGAGGGLLDAHLGDSGLDGLGHATSGLHLADVLPGPLGQVVGEPLHVVRAAPGVGHPAGARLVLQQELGVAGDPGGEIGGQGQGFVQGVGVQRLGVALRGRHGLDGGADHIVEHVLGGEAPPRGLAVGAQRQRPGVGRVERAHQLGPQQAGDPQLGHLHEEVHADAPEEAEPGGKGVDVQPRVQPGSHVLHPVGQGVGQLQVEGGPGLLHVVAGDGDGVELGHVGRGEGEDVGDDPYRRRRRVDEGVADHELLQDVVLDGPAQLFWRHPLLFAGHDVHGQNRQHRPVHGHRHGHLIQRDAVEQDLHVEDGVDGHSGHPHIPAHPRVVGVVAPMGGQVEGHRQALLPGRQVSAVEGVGVLGGGESGVLADGPRLGGVHGGVWTPQVGRQSGVGVAEVQRGPVFGGVEPAHAETLGGGPGEVVRALAGLRRHQIGPAHPVGTRGRRGVEVYAGEIRDSHRPNLSWMACRAASASQPMWM